MKKRNIIFIPLIAILITSIGFLSSCEDDDDKDSSQIDLNSFGPSPNYHNGHLKFIGKNLDKVTSIVLPGSVEVTNFITKTSALIEIEIPRETAVSGKVVLKTPQGDIETKTSLGIEEPITIASFEPATLRPGEVVTLTGTYLNLVNEVTFADNKTVTAFESQSETELTLVVPEDAQTGFILASNADEENLVFFKSLTELTVVLPAPGAITPATIKAGSDLTIAGTDLDLVKDIIFQGGTIVSDFVSQAADKIVVEVPDNAKDGVVILRPASQIEVETAPITMVVPTITNVTPAPAKNGQNITITGTNLDLVTSVAFAGEVNGEIQDGGSPTSISVMVPLTAVDGVVTLNTAASKSVTTSNALALVKPVITSFTPMTVQTVNNPSITITGTNLDIVSQIVFEGGWEASVSGATATQITIPVVPGSVTGKFKLIGTNGVEVTSAQDLTIVPDVPNITSMPADAYIGAVLSITGTNMQVATDIIFPGGIKATVFGTKSPTLLEVVVPEGVTLGPGKIKFVNTRNEVYESPEVNVKRLGVEPIQDENLVFFNFNGTGAKDSWWGGVSLVSDGNSIDGTSYGRINGSYSGWTDLFWRNGQNNFPGSTIGTDVADYVMKFDIRVVAPITGGNIKFRLEGSEGDFWYLLGPAGPSGANVPVTVGWTTMTVPLSAFKDNYGWGTNMPTDLSKVTGAFGAAFDNGSSAVNIMIDNVRFHKIN